MSSECESASDQRDACPMIIQMISMALVMKFAIGFKCDYISG